MWSCIVMLVIHQRYRRTDGQTDRQTDDMQSQDCALHYSTLRGKTETKYWYRTYYRYCRYCIIIDIIDWQHPPPPVTMWNDNTNKKLSYCCDSRSYCMQYFNTIFIVIATSQPLKKNPFTVSPRIQQLLRICVRKPTRPQSAHLCCALTYHWPVVHSTRAVY